MAKHLERDLDALRRAVAQMAGLVEAAIYKAARTLTDPDPAASAAVIAGDAAVDAAETRIQDECLKILALHQPVATDLRRVGSVILMTTDLERMGDLAVGIAERSAARPPAAVPARLGAMADRVSELVRRAVDAFVHQDAAAARAVIKMDAAVDADNDALIAGLVADMKAGPDRVDAGLCLFSTVRHLERIADHATNIAEDVVYLVEGETLRHAPPG